MCLRMTYDPKFSKFSRLDSALVNEMDRLYTGAMISDASANIALGSLARKVERAHVGVTDRTLDRYIN